MTFHERIKLLFAGWTSPIKSGPLAGARWTPASGSRFVKGTYEPASTAVFVEHVKPGNTVLDIGAHVGYYSALSAKLVGNTGTVFAFEPRPLNLSFLKRHRDLNGWNQITVHPLCVGATGGEARFESRTGSGTGHLANDGNLAVTVITLDDWHREGRLPKPDFIKVDVEGAERDVLTGAEALFASARPKLLLSIHSLELNGWVRAFLARHNYRFHFVKGSSDSVDPEIFAEPAR